MSATLRGVLLRFMFGMPLSKKQYSATRAGVFSRDNNAEKRHLRHSHFRRMVTRWCFVATLAAIGWAFFLHPTGLVRAAFVMVIAALMFVSYLLLVKAKDWRFERNEVQPLYEKLQAAITQLQSSTFSVARGGTRVALQLPPNQHLTEKQQLAIDNIIESHFGADFTSRWSLDERPPKVVWHRLPSPPEHVSWEDIAAPALDRELSSQLVFGVGSNGDFCSVDLDAESPHVLLSFGTGAGKSTTMRSVIVQLLYKGAQVYVFDIKRKSQNAFLGVPGVRIVRDVPDMISLMSVLYAEMERRKAFDDDSRVSTVFPRIAVVIEEGNSWMDEMPEETIRQYSKILLQGREMQINVFFVAQKASVAAVGGGNKAAGGSAVRDQFGTVFLSRFREQAWRSLFGESLKMPRLVSRLGSALVVRDAAEIDRLTLTNLSAEQATELALAAKASECEFEPVTEQPPTVVAPEPLVTLAEAVRTGVVPTTQPTLTKYLRLDEEADKPVPRPVSGESRFKKYRPADLAQWWAERA